MNECSLTAIGLALQQDFQAWLSYLTQDWLVETLLDEVVQPLEAIGIDLAQFGQLETDSIDLENWLTTGLNAPDLAAILPQAVVSSEVRTPLQNHLHPSVFSTVSHSATHLSTPQAFSSVQEHISHEIVSSETEIVQAEERLKGNEASIKKIDRISNLEESKQPERARITLDSNSVSRASPSIISLSEPNISASKSTQDSVLQQTPLESHSTEILEDHHKQSKSHFIQGRAIEPPSTSFEKSYQKEVISLQPDRRFQAPVLLHADRYSPSLNHLALNHLTPNDVKAVEPDPLDKSSFVEQDPVSFSVESSHQPAKGLKDLAQRLQSDRTSKITLQSLVSQAEDTTDSVEVINAKQNFSQKSLWSDAEIPSHKSVPLELDSKVSSYSMNDISTSSANSTVNYGAMNEDSIVLKSDRGLKPNLVEDKDDRADFIPSINGKSSQEYGIHDPSTDSNRVEELGLETILDAVQEQINREYRRFYGS